LPQAGSVAVSASSWLLCEPTEIGNAEGTGRGHAVRGWLPVHMHGHDVDVDVVVVGSMAPLRCLVRPCRSMLAARKLTHHLSSSLHKLQGCKINCAVLCGAGVQ
jgi:hypothetical protein